MIYSLKNTYATKVLKENVKESSPVPPPEVDNQKVIKLLSGALKSIVKLVDEPNSDFEELLLGIRDEATNALIDSGVEPD